MFTVKATYRSETRKFTFPQSILFPTYQELYHQLYRVFPITHSYFLARLIFSPDAYKPGRILIGREVHSAEDYDSSVTPLRRQWPNPLLRFTIFDEAPHTFPVTPSDTAVPSTAPSVALSEILDKRRNPPLPTILPMTSQSFITPPPPPPPQLFTTCVLPPPPPPIKMTPPPPPPIIRPTPPRFPLSGKVPSVSLEAAPCCSVAKGKGDVEALLTSFKEELQQILRNAFGAEYAEAFKATTPPIPNVDANPLVTLPVNNGAPTSSRWCFVCRTNFTGFWYGCIKCPWHAVCPGCFTKSQSAHTLSFGPSHVVQQRSTNLPSTKVSTHVSDEISNTTAAAVPHISSEHEDEALSVHYGVVCDCCDQTIAGIRHKCLDCPDYDLCSNCMESGAAGKHNPFHEFFDIETPGRVFVHTVLDGHRDRSSRNEQRSSTIDRAPVPSQRQVAEPVDQPVRHSASCNLCDSPIVGERYKCVTCPDFDTCSSCFRITPEQHPTHGFVRFSKPDDLMMRGSLPHRQAAHLAVCDSCQETIRGARYKCMHPGCPDFDLCSNCEALPIAVHPLGHPMLKLRTVDSVIPTVYRVGQTWMMDEPPSPSGSAQSTSSCQRPPTSPPIPVRSREPVFVSVMSSAVPPQTPDASAEVQDDAEEFLSPPGSPSSEGPELVPNSLTNAPAHLLVDVAEPAELPEPPSPTMDSLHQLWRKVDQEMMHLRASTVSDSTGRLADARVEPDIDSSLVNEKLPMATSTSLAASQHRDALVDVPSGYHTPSLVSSNSRPPHPLTGPADDDWRKLGSISTNITPPASMSSVLLGDTTVPDGQIFPPGAEFVKAWHMRNNGGLPWPATTEVQFVAGEMFAPECGAALKANIGIVHPGEDLDIWTGDLKAPDVPGRYVGYWRLNDGQGNFFGSSVWIDVTVADHSSDPASEHSLASSSMVMPIPHRSDSNSVSEELKDVPPTPSSPSSAKPVTDEVDDHGSDISSVSLVSVPTSDDDDAEWQDTRPHSEPMEYVVVYDSGSEDE